MHDHNSGVDTYSEAMGLNKPPEPNWKRDLLPYLSDRAAALLLAVETPTPPEEIRLRANRPIQLRFADGERMLSGGGGRAPVSEEDCERMLAAFAGHSLYACEEEISQGFLTLSGGYRVGFCGKAVRGTDGALRFDSVRSFCIRIAREILGASQALLPRIIDGAGRARSSLLVSPPGCGKTTILRDAARALSTGAYGARACSVGVVDARYELGGGADGTIRFNLGPRTDVLFGTTRAEGMRMMVRNLAPEVIVTDEIGSREDADAIFEAIRSGVAVLASAHAADLRALARRQALRKLVGCGAFERVVLLGRSAGTGTIERVWSAAELEREEGARYAEALGGDGGACGVYGGGDAERAASGAAAGCARGALPGDARAV